MYRLPRPAAATAFHATMMRLEHFSAKWIRFAAKNAAQQRRELIPCHWDQLSRASDEPAGVGSPLSRRRLWSEC
jgi:hypothetical protein